MNLGYQLRYYTLLGSDSIVGNPLKVAFLARVRIVYLTNLYISMRDAFLILVSSIF